MADQLIPGVGYVQEWANDEALIPGGGFIQEVGSGTGGTTYFQTATGNMPAASGTVATQSVFTQSAAGVLPGMGGVVSRLISKGVSGALPSQSGGIVRQTSKAVSGSLPSPVGGLVKRVEVLLSGTMDNFLGVLAGSFSTAQALTGILSGLSGVLTTILNPVIVASTKVKLLGSSLRKFLQGGR